MILDRGGIDADLSQTAQCGPFVEPGVEGDSGLAIFVHEEIGTEDRDLLMYTCRGT